jgi:type VI secretion system secreted protein VgrG
MGNATQQNRDFAIKTALGEDDLLLRRATISEYLGRPFQIVAELLSEEPEINFDDVVGKTAHIRVSRGDEDIRYFHGYVSRFQQVEQENDFARYSLTLVPWLWFLTRTADCRIFQGKTAVDIIKQVFKDAGFTDFKDSLVGSCPTRDYCVQYRETDFNFVSRLMEEEGIYYFFQHEKEKHTLVLANAKSAHAPFGEYKEIAYRPRSEALGDSECISDWVMEKSVQPGAFVHTDYDFEKPKSNLLTNSTIKRQHAMAEFEIYDYPGEYVANSDGERSAKIRIEELQSRHEIFHGQTTARGVCNGSLFSLKDHARGDQNREYLVIGTEMQLDAGPYEAGQEGDTKSFLSCSLTAIDSSRPYRSQRATPKPLIQGPQTAVVTGKSGEEIWPDKYGRVKVQFHWDREGKFDENSSCWIRVAQVWAGKQWGAMHIPRMGQEVIVEFLEGDPDRPIITGRVYNADQTVPYELPADKTQSGIKSRSSKEGTGNHFNEIRFEDKKGEENVFIQAQKDHDLLVKNDLREKVGGGDDGSAAEGSRHLLVKKDQKEKVEGNKHQTVVGDQMRKVDGADHLTVGGDQAVKVGGDANLDAAMNLNAEAGQKISIKAGTDLHEKTGMNYGLDAGMAIHLKAGMNIVIEGSVQVSLKAGPSFVDIGPAGVSISGPMVMINSGGAAGSGGGSSPTAPLAAKSPEEPDEATG